MLIQRGSDQTNFISVKQELPRANQKSKDRDEVLLIIILIEEAYVLDLMIFVIFVKSISCRFKFLKLSET